MVTLLSDFSNIYSHENKLLVSHISEMLAIGEEIKTLCFRFYEDFFKLLVIFHDLGKISKEWQEKLKKGENLPKHSGLSSFILFLIYKYPDLLDKYFFPIRNFLNKNKCNLIEIDEETLAILLQLIALHHSDIKWIKKSEIGNLFSYGEETTLSEYLSRIKFVKNDGKTEEFSLRDNEIEEFKELITKKFKDFGKRFEKSEIDMILNSFSAFKIADSLSASLKRSFGEEEIKNVLRDYGLINLNIPIGEDEVRKVLHSLNKKEIDENRLKYQLKFLKEPINILRAPTGFGKTVTSILKGVSQSRVLMVLPTITAIQQFLNRSKEILYLLMKDFTQEIVGEYFYFFNPFRSEMEDGNKNSSVDKLENYFLSRYLLKPLMITTIDQILLSYLHIGDFYIRFFSLQDRLFILDEIHLLSPKMLFLFIKFLKDYGYLLNDVIFMSATFPDYLINILENELDRKEFKSLLLNDFYPDNRIIPKILKEKENKFYCLVEEIKDAIKNGNRTILIIFNTVKKAQEFYKKLLQKEEELKKECEIILLHSRHIYKHRKEKEEKILKLLKDIKERNINKILIVISTQVVEVSLDVDFDFLITENAPLPELIQRFGRVFRNRSNPQTPNVVIFPHYDESKHIYSEELMRQSFKIIEEQFNGRFVNEKELIKYLDRSEYVDKFIKEYENYKKEYESVIDTWLRDYCYYFYNLPVIIEEEKFEEEIGKILNLRDSLNLLVTVSLDDLDNEERKEYEYFEELRRSSIKNKDFENFYRAKLWLREFTLPLPFYYFQKILPTKKTPSLPPGIYKKDIGLDIEELKKKLKEDIIL